MCIAVNKRRLFMRHRPGDSGLLGRKIGSLAMSMQV
jgi:hypothetical protein